MREAAAFACGVLVLLALVGDERENELLRVGGKLAASASFLAFALASGLPAAGLPGRITFAGLALSFVGDAFLLGRRKSLFVAGLAAFLLAHLAYVAAFAGLGLGAAGLWGSLPVVLAAGVLTGRWLSPHVGRLRPAVFAYVAAISLMMAAAAGAATAPGPRGARLLIPVAAAAFAASDLLVARERFVAPGRWNRRIGLPLYYAAQLAFGGAVAAAGRLPVA